MQRRPMCAATLGMPQGENDSRVLHVDGLLFGRDKRPHAYTFQALSAQQSSRWPPVLRWENLLSAKSAEG